MKYLLPLLLLFTLSHTSCKSDKPTDVESDMVQEEPVQREDITIEDAKMILDSRPEVIFLDVRTPEEIAEGYIDGALIADVKASGFEEEIRQLDPSKEYIVYCRSGRRSVKASDIMIGQGFTKVKNMKGGYNAWKEKYK